MAAACASASAAGVPPERALYEDGPSGRHLLDSGWRTGADRTRGGPTERSRCDSRFGRAVSVPHAYNARDFSRRGFAGRVQWYCTRFDLPSGAATAWKLRFESVNRRADVWVNGHRIGSHDGAYLPFELAVAGARARGNVLVVRVDGRLSRRDLPPGNRPRGWWNYGGILREVYLRRVSDLDLSDLQVLPRAGGNVHVEGMVRNASGEPRYAGFVTRTSGPNGYADQTIPAPGPLLAPGQLGRIAFDLDIPSPVRWSPANPALYRLEVEMDGGQTTVAHFGLRDFGVDPQGRATLDGRPLSLRGASFHEESAGRGAALSAGDRNQIVAQLRALAADFTREHYPPHPALLEAFDRAGIVFWEQVPVWRMRGADIGRLKGCALAALREAVLRDRNHASVMAWSVSNETLAGGAAERGYLRDALGLVHRLDPTGRLTAVDTTLPLRSIPDSYSAVDAIGLNEYLGWYGGHSRDLPDVLAGLRARFPRQALFVTELGAEANRSGPAASKGSYRFQRDYVSEHLRLIDAAPEVSGALVWSLRDFAVRPGWTGGNPHPRSPFNFKGLIARDGTRKPAFAAAAALFAATPYAR